MSQYAIDWNEIQSAATRIAPHVVRTPVLSNEPLSQALACQLSFKCENLQHIGAFKARGACNAVLALDDATARRGVVTHSSGNHAAALARAARIRGISAHIVMPRNSSPLKLAAVRDLGVTPILCEPNAESRQATADEVQQETGAELIHPYDNRLVMAGQGTTGAEILEQMPQVNSVVVPVGGGGLLSGVLTAIKTQRPDVKVYAAEPARADDAARSLQSGKIEMPTRYDTVADGLRTPLGEHTFPIIRDLVDGILLVSEEDITAATRDIVRSTRQIVEPSGAVTLAAVQANREIFTGLNVVAVISGGNVEFNQLAAICSPDKRG